MYCEFCGRKFYGWREHSKHVYLSHLNNRAIKYCIYCKQDAINYCRYCKKNITYPSYFSCKLCGNCYWCEECNYKKYIRKTCF